MINYKTHRFRVAFSFRRNESNVSYINKIYDKLIKAGLSSDEIFYTEKPPHVKFMISKDIVTLHGYIYQRASLVVKFYSKGYDRSKWCSDEKEYILGRAHNKKSNIICIIDDSSIKKLHPKFQSKALFIRREYKNLGAGIDELIAMILDKSSKTKKRSKSTVEIKKVDILGKSAYDELLDKINSRGNKFINSEFFHKREKLLLDFYEKLLSNGIVFVEGPLLCGKTKFIQYFADKYRNDIKIIGTYTNLKKPELFSEITELYHYWFQRILEFIEKDEKNDIKFVDYPDDVREMCFNKDAFSVAFEKKQEMFDKSKLLVFLRLLDSVKDKINYSSKEIAVTFHLDNIQNYATDKVFSNFIDDIMPFCNSNLIKENNIKSKLIIATRAFPQDISPLLVIRINNLIENDINKLFLSIPETSLKLEITEISKLVFSFTEGHIFFVHQVIKKYLEIRNGSENRLKDNPGIQHYTPIELLHHIFEQKDYWLYDSKNYNYSEFLIQLRNIITLHNGYKEKFISFLKEKEEPVALSAIDYVSNPIIQQSGFGIFTQSKDKINKFGNKLLKLYYTKNNIFIKRN